MSLAYARAVAADPTVTVAEFHKKDFGPGRTKQSFKDATDINKILNKYQKTGTLSHLAKYAPVYGDFSDMPDLLTANSRFVEAERIFSELPSEIRKEFNNDPAAFFRYAGAPDMTIERLTKELPALAAPGQQHPRSALNNGTAASTAPASPTLETAPADGGGDGGAADASGGDGGG